MLDRLPNELFWAITKQLAGADLKNLCEVSKYLYEVTIPRLYESVTFLVTRPGQYQSVTSFETVSMLRRITCFPSAHLKHTKHLCLKDPYYKYRENRARCLYHDFPELEDVFEFSLRKECAAAKVSRPALPQNYSEPDSFFDFRSPLRLILSNLTENLRTFKWETGTCIPGHVLGHNSDLMKIQSKTEHVSLITNGSCRANGPMPSVLLGEPKVIKSLSWKGLSRAHEFDSVRGCIEMNGHGIETLVLDLVPPNHFLSSCGKAESAYYDGRRRREQRDDLPVNFFATDVLGVFPGEKRVVLPHLSSLSLSKVSFQAAAKEMQHALNITHLSSLKLRNCGYSLALLDTIVDGDQKMRLRSFELVIDNKANTFQGARKKKHDVSISAFLDSFQGLEDLYLMITDPIDWGLISKSISNHTSTLDRLITHRSRHGVFLAPHDPAILWCNELNDLYQGTNLTCIGTSSISPELVLDWENISPKPTCKILHLRVDLSKYHDDDEPDDTSTHLAVVDLEASSREDVTSNEEATLHEELSADGFQSNMSTQPQSNTPAEGSGFSSLPVPAAPEPSHQPEKTRDITAVNYARWAFSDKGLPNLQIFVIGDFSRESPHGRLNLLLCRDANASEIGRPAIRAITQKDFRLWDLIHENKDMLAACATY